MKVRTTVSLSKELLDFVKAQKAEEEEDEDTGRISDALYSKAKSRRDVDYSQLKKMSQSKLASVRVLIDEIVSKQEGV